MELVNRARDFFDALWSLCLPTEKDSGSVTAYSQEGIINLLTVVGNSLLDALKNLVSELDVWIDPFQKVCPMKAPDSCHLSHSRIEPDLFCLSSSSQLT